MTSPRRLPYPLNQSAAIVNTTSSDTPDDVVLTWPTDDPDEKVDIVVRASFSDWLKIASCVDVGRDIAYPDDQVEIWQIWGRLIVATICEGVLSCVQTNALVQDAIANQVIVSGVNPDRVPPYQSGIIGDRFPVAAQQSEIATITGCDRNELWGMIFETVNRICDTGLQTLQQIVAINDKAERIANAVALIPIFGDLLGEAVLLIINEADNIRNAYEAYDDLTVREQIACDLFQLVCEDCRMLTYEELIGYFGTLAGVDWRDIAVQAFIDYWLGTTGVGNLAVFYATNTLVLYTLFLQSKFGSARGTQALATWALLGKDTPSNDWELLCGPCGPTLSLVPTADALDSAITYLGNNQWRAVGYERPTDLAFGIRDVENRCFVISPNAEPITGLNGIFHSWQFCNDTTNTGPGGMIAGAFKQVVITRSKGTGVPDLTFTAILQQ